MFDHIRGTVIRRSPTAAVLEAGGVGYLLSISLSTYRKLPDSGPARLFAYLQVKEDDMKLYGFADEAEREMFRMLLSAKGVGPTTAITILSGCELNDLVKAIAEENVNLLKTIRGVGEKTASRIVLELKGRVDKIPGLMPAATGASRTAEDAIAALMSLDVSRAKASEAVRKALAAMPDQASIEDIIKEALKHA